MPHIVVFINYPAHIARKVVEKALEAIKKKFISR